MLADAGLTLESPLHPTKGESCRPQAGSGIADLSCFVTALSGTLGKSLSNPFCRRLVVSCGWGSAEKLVAGPESRATCRRARHETLVPSAVRGPPAGARWRAPLFSGVTWGLGVTPLPAEGERLQGSVAGSTEVAQQRGPCARGSQLPGRSAWPHRQAKGFGWPRATPLPPATFAFPRGKLARRGGGSTIRD